MAIDKIETLVVRALGVAGKAVGVYEVPKDSNRGPLIDVIQKEFGLKGQQYCVMYTLWAYIVALMEMGYKMPAAMKLASSQSLYEYAKARDCVYTDASLMRTGDIVIWRKMMLWQGHAGLVCRVLDSRYKSFITYEGNTSPDSVVDSGTGESQRNGGGIFKRTRFAGRAEFVKDAFYIRGFINMRKLLNEVAELA